MARVKTVTIEGSRVRRSVVLAPGERRTVSLTPAVQNLIDQGFAFVVDDAPKIELKAPETPEPFVPAPEVADAPIPREAAQEPVAPAVPVDVAAAPAS